MYQERPYTSFIVYIISVCIFSGYIFEHIYFLYLHVPLLYRYAAKHDKTILYLIIFRHTIDYMLNLLIKIRKNIFNFILRNILMVKN